MIRIMLFIFFTLYTLQSQGQNMVLFQEIENKTEIKLKENERIVLVNKEVLSQKNFTLIAFNKNLNFVNNRQIDNGNDMHGYIAQLENSPYYFSISFKDDRFSGKLVIGDTLHHVSSLSKNTAILKTSLIEKTNHECANASMHVPNLNQDNWEQGKNNSMKMMEVDIESTCKLRILVAYTPKVASNHSSIETDINNAIAEFNLTLSNSNVNHQAVLVSTVQISSNAGFEGNQNPVTSIERLQSPIDGYADDLVTTLKAAYYADIVVLVIEDNFSDGSVGMAYEIGADATTAVCIAKYENMVTTYTLSHEIGHLLGCRHQNDTNPLPFSDAKGFMNNGWGTIMTRLDAVNGQRFPLWSNPDIYVPIFGTNIGVTGERNCARVINETISQHAMGFRIFPNQIIIGTGSIPENTTYEFIAGSIIANSGFNAPESSSGFMLASEYIELGNGTSIYGDFVAEIGNLRFCGDGVIPNGQVELYRLRDTSSVRLSNTVNEYNIYPNPISTSDKLKIKNLNHNSNYNFILYDTNGKTIMYDKSNASHFHEIDLSTVELNPGVYFIKVIENERTVNNNKVIMIN